MDGSMDDLDFTSPAREALYDPGVARLCFESLGKPEVVADAQPFFSENDASDRMYLLTAGGVRLVKGKRSLDIVKEGEIFGEMAVITGRPRTASAIAKGECRALSLDARQFEQALAKTPEFALMLMSILINRLRLSDAILARSGKMTESIAREASRVFDHALLGELADALKRKPQALPARHTIMKEGDMGGFMYAVIDGTVAISIRSNTVEHVGPGGVFGEMALVDQSPRAASAAATTDSSLLPINSADFLSLVKSRPAFAVSLLKSLALRLGRLTAQQA
jgi:CRP/FNR family transcriptional regulator, cyclic AMP receptor protein